MPEIWKPIPGYEGYEASDHGRVRSIDRVVRNGKFWRGKILRPSKSDNGYLTVVVRNGRLHSLSVHKAVMMTFTGPCPEGMCCCHNDGDKRNNSLENLRYDTYSANSFDRALHGTNVDGERNGQSKISDEDARFIMMAALEFEKTMAKRFNVTEGCIRQILDRRKWRKKFPS